MAATVLLLLLLVLITPRLIGGPEDISSLPRLILNYDEDRLILFVTSLSGTYLYRTLYLNLTPEGGGNGPLRAIVSDSHGLERVVPLSATTRFSVEAVAVDRGDTPFDLVLDVSASQTASGWRFQLLFPDEPQPRTVTVTDEDFVDGLPYLLQRREVS